MQNIITTFNPEAKPYKLCMHVNGYKCFMYHDLDDSFNIKKTYIDFVFPVQEINYLVAEFEVEFSHDKQAVLWLCSLGYVLYKNKHDDLYDLPELIFVPILFSMLVTFVMLLLAGAVSVLLM